MSTIFQTFAFFYTAVFILFGICGSQTEMDVVDRMVRLLLGPIPPAIILTGVAMVLIGAKNITELGAKEPQPTQTRVLNGPEGLAEAAWLVGQRSLGYDRDGLVTVTVRRSELADQALDYYNWMNKPSPFAPCSQAEFYDVRINVIEDMPEEQGGMLLADLRRALDGYAYSVIHGESEETQEAQDLA